MTNNAQISFDIGAFLLFIVFLCLKLTGTISWSWWIVTLPLWGGIVLVIGFLLIVLIIGLVLGAIALLVDN